MARVVKADEKRIKIFIEHILKIVIKVVRETIQTQQIQRPLRLKIIKTKL